MSSNGGMIMHAERIVDVLNGVAFFHGLTIDDLQRFADISHKISFQGEDVLIHEGAMESVVYIIIKGKIKVILPQKIKGKETYRMSNILLNNLRPGDCFGEYSLFDGKPTSATVIAAEPVEVIKIKGSDFQYIIDNDDRIAKIIYLNMLKILIHRLRQKDHELDMITIVR
jgi:CRP-like cAMP-binding protein